MALGAEAATALVVEDNVLFRSLISNVLRARFPLVRLLEAGGAQEALEQARRHRPVLVVMDIRLPDGNGLELTRTICHENPRTHVIVCTSHDLPEYRCAATECGAAHYVPKDGLDPVTFLEAAAAALEPERDV